MINTIKCFVQITKYSSHHLFLGHLLELWRECLVFPLIL